MTELDILAEGRERLRSSAPCLTDEQFETWAANSRLRGAEFALTLEGCVARYQRASAEASE